MTRRSLAWMLSSAVLVGLGACDGGGGSTQTGGNGTGSSSGSSDDDACSLRTTLSGGLDRVVGDTSQACVYSSGTIALTPLDGSVVVLVLIKQLDRGQTGSVEAEIQVNSGDDRWSGASCLLDIASNVLVEPASDAGGISFDQYLLKGNGSCSSPATVRGDAGAKAPITIAPFTFVFRTLMY